MTRSVPADPYRFPLGGRLEPGNTALAVIDMQVDFCTPGGYIARMGCDLTSIRAPLAPIGRVLEAMRGAGFTVVHTRETFAPDLSDVQPHRTWRGTGGDLIVVGDRGPLGRCLVRGEPCWEIVPEVAPLTGEVVFDKNAYGAFGSTGIDAYLRERGVENLVLAGITTNCCIQSNLREALDRGYDCLVLEDCCGAVTRQSHERSMAMIRNPDGVLGAVSTSPALIAAIAGA